jgi:hypothetical protein
MRALGFTFVEELCLLGLKINHDLSSLDSLHNTTVSKLRKICNFWARFNISIPGRLNIAKSLLLSQINYLGCIITPNREQLNSITQVISGFILGRTNISKERLFLKPEEGGLGMISIENFLTAQQAIWVKRANISTRDCWRYDLRLLAKGNCLNICPANLSVERHPILNNIVESFFRFKTAFYSRNDNFKESILLNNPILHRGLRDRGQLNHTFFLQVPAIPDDILAGLKFSDVCSEAGMHSLAEINRTCIPMLNLVSYLRLGEACTNFLNKLGRNRVTDGSALGLGPFLSRFKNGSKPIRNILGLGP